MTAVEFLESREFKHISIVGNIYAIIRHTDENWTVYDTTGEDTVVREYTDFKTAYEEYMHLEAMEKEIA